MKYTPTSGSALEQRQKRQAEMNADKYDYNYEPDHVPYPDSETPKWRQVETDTVADLRTVAIAALDRGEYDIAIALIQLIRDFK